MLLVEKIGRAICNMCSLLSVRWLSKDLEFDKLGATPILGSSFFFHPGLRFAFRLRLSCDFLLKLNILDIWGWVNDSILC